MDKIQAPIPHYNQFKRSGISLVLVPSYTHMIWWYLKDDITRCRKKSFKISIFCQGEGRWQVNFPLVNLIILSKLKKYHLGFWSSTNLHYRNKILPYISSFFISENIEIEIRRLKGFFFNHWIEIVHDLHT